MPHAGNFFNSIRPLSKVWLYSEIALIQLQKNIPSSFVWFFPNRSFPEAQ
jgi:hypothetical protein